MTLIDNVTKWLGDNGYPLEMEVARILELTGFSVVQSDYYMDLESDTQRETDVVAYEEFQDENCRAIFSLVIECKSGKGKPWVLFTKAANYPIELSITRRAASREGNILLNALSSSDEIQALSLFNLPERTGYGLTVALGKTNKDWAYDALMSVCKASIGLLNRIGNVAENTLIPFAWPIIVIEAPLFESYINNEGAVITEEINKGLLIWRNPVIQRHTFVQIYTKNQFEAEAETIKEEANTFLRLALSHQALIAGL